MEIYAMKYHEKRNGLCEIEWSVLLYVQSLEEFLTEDLNNCGGPLETSGEPVDLNVLCCLNIFEDIINFD